jgi:hypothetical protein
MDSAGRYITLSMTPLTHAAVGTALYEKLRAHPTLKYMVFPLAFLSHYLLDAVPHFEEFGPLFKYRDTIWIFLGLGLLGLLFAGLIWSWNRDAARVWLLLCLWIGLGVYGPVLWRVLSAILIVGAAAATRRMRPRLGYLVAGMLALSADFFPSNWRTMRALHDTIHYHTDWGTILYRRFAGTPDPASWHVRAANPYFLGGWALEILVEACVFFGALWILVRGSIAETKQLNLDSEPKPRPVVSSDTKAVA